MKFINLTDHIVTDTNTGKSFEPKGEVRAQCDSYRRYRANGIPVFSTLATAREPLPDPVAGVCYIVSNLYLNTCPERTDVVAPGKVVRNEAGEPVACRGFRTHNDFTLIFDEWFATTNAPDTVKELCKQAFYQGCKSV